MCANNQVGSASEQRPVYSGSFRDAEITLHDEVFLDNDENEPKLNKILTLYEQAHCRFTLLNSFLSSVLCVCMTLCMHVCYSQFDLHVNTRSVLSYCIRVLQRVFQCILTMYSYSALCTLAKGCPIVEGGLHLSVMANLHTDVPDTVLMESAEDLGNLSGLTQLELSFSYDFSNVLCVHIKLYLLQGDETSQASIGYDKGFLVS